MFRASARKGKPKTVHGLHLHGFVNDDWLPSPRAGIVPIVKLNAIGLLLEQGRPVWGSHPAFNLYRRAGLRNQRARTYCPKSDRGSRGSHFRHHILSIVCAGEAGGVFELLASMFGLHLPEGRSGATAPGGPVTVPRFVRHPAGHGKRQSVPPFGVSVRFGFVVPFVPLSTLETGWPAAGRLPNSMVELERPEAQGYMRF